MENVPAHVAVDPTELAVAPLFKRFYPACEAHGIPATTASELARAGLLRPFKIAGRTYIALSEFSALVARMKDPKARERLTALRRRKTEGPVSEAHRRAGLASAEARRRKAAQAERLQTKRARNA